MPERQQRQNEKLRLINGVYTCLWLLTLPALTGAVFTRRKLGVRTVMPVKFMLMGLIVWILHDFVVRPDDPQGRKLFFDGSPASYVCLAACALGAAHFAEALFAYRRGEARHSFFWGEPWLTRLGIPFLAAVFLDPPLVFAAGWQLQSVDAVIGEWLMWGGLGLLGITLNSLHRLFADGLTMRDAQIYSEHVQSSNRPGPRQARRGAAAEEELSTGARRR